MLFFALQCGIALGQEIVMRNVFTATLECFPKATLLDVYKGAFQGYFGPAHIISDSLACVRYIEHEMGLLDADDSLPLYEEVGEYGYYYRVNLRLVRDGVIPISRLVSCLMRSSQVIYFSDNDTSGIAGPISLEEWRNRWSELVAGAPESMRQLPGFEEDSATLFRLLEGGNYVFHHSAPFNEAYHYHYRLIRRDIFQKELLPLIKGSAIR